MATSGRLYHRKKAQILPEASDCKNIHWLKLERGMGDDGLAQFFDGTVYGLIPL
jgi:hypothetical protein